MISGRLSLAVGSRDIVIIDILLCFSYMLNHRGCCGADISYLFRLDIRKIVEKFERALCGGFGANNSGKIETLQRFNDV